MKTIHVVAAVILAQDKNNNPIVFATQRGSGQYKDFWEFPGGKVEPGEEAPDALVREIEEELETKVQIQNFLDTIEYDYPEFHLSMDCFVCSLLEGDLVLKEHEDARWLTRKTLYSVDWLPADKVILGKVEEILKG
jgi:8-oxo-dGTP diphosphatase